jgi:hypothetical protein
MTTPDEAVEAAAEVLRRHQLSGPFGGTASSATCPCSCGESNEIRGGTRGMAAAKGRYHLARAVIDAVAPALMALGEQRVMERLGEAGERESNLHAVVQEHYDRAEKADAERDRLAAKIDEYRTAYYDALATRTKAEADLAAAEQRGAEKALREAADAVESAALVVNGLGDRATKREFYAAWLRARADRLAAQSGEAGS